MSLSFLVFPFLIASPGSELVAPQTILAPAPPNAGLQTNPQLPDTGSRGSGIFAEPTPSLDETAAACSLPSGWSLYNIQHGDSWIDLSASFGISLEQHIAANCLVESIDLVAGQWIFVPTVTILTPTPINTLPSTVQPQPTLTK